MLLAVDYLSGKALVFWDMMMRVVRATSMVLVGGMGQSGQEGMSGPWSMHWCSGREVLQPKTAKQPRSTGRSRCFPPLFAFWSPLLYRFPILNPIESLKFIRKRYRLTARFHKTI